LPSGLYGLKWALSSTADILLGSFGILPPVEDMLDGLCELREDLDDVIACLAEELASKKRLRLLEVACETAFRGW
jgi:hypothetical protein